MLIFNALIKSGSVKQAAKRMSLSESAFSHALARLRQSLNNDLFVRRGNSMEPTDLALQIAPHIQQALSLMHQALEVTQDFNPTTDDREFHVAASDFALLILAPRLMRQWNHVAPGILLRTEKMEAQAIHRLSMQEIDFVIGIPYEGELPPNIGCELLLEEHFLMIARHQHPHLSPQENQPLSLEHYVSLPHILVSHWDGKPGDIDSCLALLGLKRRVQLVVSAPQIAAMTVATTDMVAILPASIARRMQTDLPLSTRPLPIQIPPSHMMLYYHKGRLQEKAYDWMRQSLRQAARSDEHAPVSPKDTQLTAKNTKPALLS